MQQEEHIAVFQALVGSMGYVRIRFGRRAPSLPDLEAPTSSRSRLATLDPDAFYPDPEGPEWGA